MTTREIIKDIMSTKNMTNADMANILGLSQQAFWDRINSKRNKSITVSKMNEMLKILGYELVVMPRGKANRIDGAYLVDDLE